MPTNKRYPKQPPTPHESYAHDYPLDQGVNITITPGIESLPALLRIQRQPATQESTKDEAEDQETKEAEMQVLMHDIFGSADTSTSTTMDSPKPQRSPKKPKIEAPPNSLDDTWQPEKPWTPSIAINATELNKIEYTSYDPKEFMFDEEIYEWLLTDNTPTPIRADTELAENEQIKEYMKLD